MPPIIAVRTVWAWRMAIAAARMIRATRRAARRSNFVRIGTS